MWWVQSIVLYFFIGLCQHQMAGGQYNRYKYIANITYVINIIPILCIVENKFSMTDRQRIKSSS